MLYARKYDGLEQVNSWIVDALEKELKIILNRRAIEFNGKVYPVLFARTWEYMQDFGAEESAKITMIISAGEAGVAQLTIEVSKARWQDELESCFVYTILEAFAAREAMAVVKAAQAGYLTCLVDYISDDEQHLIVFDEDIVNEAMSGVAADNHYFFWAESDAPDLVGDNIQLIGFYLETWLPEKLSGQWSL